MEGVLGLGFCRALTGAVRLGPWHGGQAACSMKVGRSGGEHERWSARGSTVGRQRTSEIASPGKAPPAEGRRGSGGRRLHVSHVRPSRVGCSWSKLSRLKTVAFNGGSGSANCATHP
jgi:hypothetical protein